MLKLTLYFFIWWKSEPVEFLQKKKSIIRVLSEISNAPLAIILRLVARYWLQSVTF